MIRSFRHKGLRGFHERGSSAGVGNFPRQRLQSILQLLDVAELPADMDIAGLRLHPLKGDLIGHWSVSLSGNWRIVFRFDGRDVVDVDLVDYH